MKTLINEIINALWIPSLTRKQWAIGVGFFTFLLLLFGAAESERYGLAVAFFLALAYTVRLAHKEEWFEIENDPKII